MHDDNAQTICGGLRSGPHGLRFFLTKQFLVSTDLSDRLQLSLSLVLVQRLAPSKSCFLYHINGISCCNRH
jgi:hypothetical protein